MGTASGSIQEANRMDPILRILFLGTEGISCAAIHKGRVKNRHMGWCFSVSPGGINCYRWRKWCRDGGEPWLEKLSKGDRRGLGQSLQDIVCPMPLLPEHEPRQPWSPDSPPPLPCPCSVQGWIHKRSQLTELKKTKIKLMVRMGRNSRAPLRVFTLAQSVSPPRAKPPSSRLGSLEEQLQFHIQLKKQHLSKYSFFPARK